MDEAITVNAIMCEKWCVIGLLVLAFGAAGLAKLAGVEQMHVSFSTMGLPAWFGYFIGACEVAGAIGLLVRKLTTTAAIGLTLISLGAFYFHLTYETFANGIPAFVLVHLCLLVIYARKKGFMLYTSHVAMIISLMRGRNKLQN